MAVLFSAVSVTANDQEIEFYVGGIPREFDDLEGWTAFDNFMEDIDEESEVSVHAKAYLYVDEETYKATPEEVAYFMKRMEIVSMLKGQSEHQRGLYLLGQRHCRSNGS